MVKLLRLSYSTRRVDTRWISRFGGERRRKKLANKREKANKKEEREDKMKRKM
jgi:hypothetical protein